MPMQKAKEPFGNKTINNEGKLCDYNNFLPIAPSYPAVSRLFFKLNYRVEIYAGSASLLCIMKNILKASSIPTIFVMLEELTFPQINHKKSE